MLQQSLSSRSGYGDELIRTLSSNGALAAADGFLFVPDIDKRDCEVQAGVPSNVTRLSDIPLPANVGAVAVAPWTSAECATKYLAAARAVAGLRALIFYLPDPNLDSQHPFPTNGPLTIPPVASDPVWGLGDGGRWKGDNGYPVYALPSPAGVDLMQQLSSYSGNITQLPHGPELLKTYGSDGNVKLYIQIDTG